MTVYNHWTGELDWWIDIFQITFMLSSQTHLPVGLYMQYINLETRAETNIRIHRVSVFILLSGYSK